MPKIDLLVNRIRMDMVKSGNMLSIEDVSDILAINIIGIVPDDENIVISANQGEPLVGNDSLAGQAYNNIVQRIMGNDMPFLDLEQKKGLIGKLSKIFKKK